MKNDDISQEATYFQFFFLRPVIGRCFKIGKSACWYVSLNFLRYACVPEGCLELGLNRG